MHDKCTEFKNLMSVFKNIEQQKWNEKIKLCKTCIESNDRKYILNTTITTSKWNPKINFRKMNALNAIILHPYMRIHKNNQNII